MKKNQKKSPDYCNIQKINPVNPQPELIKKAADLIRKNGCVVFPTWCLYGIGADALNAKSVEKVFNIKKRPADKPILVLIPDISFLNKFVTEVPDSAITIMEHFWPGKITIVFNAKKNIPENLISGTGKIGIRIPEHPVALALVRELYFPITGTSANISSEPGCFDISQLNKEIIENSDLILDIGPLKGGTGSTVIDVTSSPPVILREGEILPEKIFNLLQ